MKKFTAVIIGAGNRGTAYAKHMKELSEKFDVVGVADPIEARRNKIKDWFSIPEENCYLGYQEILAQPKMADIAVIATQDNMHTEPALMAIEKGYHLLLEKPVAPTPEECIQICHAAKEKGVEVLVCHVLRFTPFYKTIKKLLMDGTIGDVMSVLAVEGVGNVHQSHSYVRGDWKTQKTAAPMLLAKCCHDLDIIQWLVDKDCKKVSSFGELTYFKPENAPEGAPQRCFNTQCPARATCPYDVEKVYLGENAVKWMTSAVARGFIKEGTAVTEEAVIEGLKNTEFGDCAFQTGNDVVDHQIVNMEFDGTVTASLTMNAFNKGGRYIRIFGTKGELFAYHSDTKITVYTFEDRQYTEVEVMKTEESIAGGHGGGDKGIVVELYEYLLGDYKGFCAADIETSIRNHILGFAAEKAREEDTVENIHKYSEAFGYDY
ncbi:MAG: Gfo/Idh/MocA family oxidoreductase [Clostridia bacterium]|nr:Gfo/Idh/MocA family oxidoreductase [Clostridia bacterium]